MKLIGIDGSRLASSLGIKKEELAAALVGLMLVADRSEAMAETSLAKAHPRRRAYLKGEASGLRVAAESLASTFCLTKELHSGIIPNEDSKEDDDAAGKGSNRQEAGDEDEGQRNILSLHRETLRRQQAGNIGTVPDGGTEAGEDREGQGVLSAEERSGG